MMLNVTRVSGVTWTGSNGYANFSTEPTNRPQTLLFLSYLQLIMAILVVRPRFERALWRVDQEGGLQMFSNNFGGSTEIVMGFAKITALRNRGWGDLPSAHGTTDQGHITSAAHARYRHG